MSYHLPPNNAIATICSPSPPNGTLDPVVRQEIYDIDTQLQTRSINNQNGGNGAIYGWGTRRTK